MRKLILEMQLSIDGFVSSTGNSPGWMIWDFSQPWTWDEALQQYHTDLTHSIDCVLLSRKMAEEGFIDHWKRISLDTANPQSTFAANITKARKIVFSRSPRPPQWAARWDNTELAEMSDTDLTKGRNPELKNENNTDLIKGDNTDLTNENNTDLAKGGNPKRAEEGLVTAIEKLKQQPGKNMIVYGGASFVSSLIKARLIDEYHLVINPSALGNGLPIFKEVGDRLSLQLLSARSYPCGVAVLIYQALIPAYQTPQKAKNPRA